MPPATRRAILLGAAIAIPTLLIALGATAAWPLFALPLALALPLGGPRGMAVALTVSAIVLTLVSGRPGTDGPTLTLAMIAFAATGAAIGAAYEAKERALERAAIQTFIDRLTGLHNQAFLADTLSRECLRAERCNQPLSLIALHLDDLDQIAAHHGAEAASRQLAAVGRAIKSCARGSDLVTRHDRDGLAVVVPGPAEEALDAAERFRAVAAGVTVTLPSGANVATTVCAGVAERSPDDHDGADLLARALTALDEVPGGRDGVGFSLPGRRFAAAS